MIPRCLLSGKPLSAITTPRMKNHCSMPCPVKVGNTSWLLHWLHRNSVDGLLMTKRPPIAESETGRVAFARFRLKAAEGETADRCALARFTSSWNYHVDKHYQRDKRIFSMGKNSCPALRKGMIEAPIVLASLLQVSPRLRVALPANEDLFRSLAGQTCGKSFITVCSIRVNPYQYRLSDSLLFPSFS